MPGASELTYKWRHLCCFTKRQLASVSGVDQIQGYDDCGPEDQALLGRLVRGELVGDAKIIGRISGAGADHAAATTSPGKKTGGTRKRNREGDSGSDDFGGAPADSDATETEDEDASPAPPPLKPMCPHGADCYRKNPEHFAEYRHPGDPVPPPAATTVKVKIDPKKDAAAGAAPISATKPIAYAKNGKPICPFDALCFRTALSHFKEYEHPIKDQVK